MVTTDKYSNNELVKWLRDEKGYKHRSSKDVISRIRRIEKFHNLPMIITEETIFQVEQEEDFKKLSVSIKSQLRLALRLLRDYQQRQK